MTGGGLPSAVAKSIGSIPTSPSWRFQYVHIGRSRTRSPEGVLTSIVSGIPSIAQNRFAHGPGAMTTCSPTSTRPADVSTAVIEPSGASSKPVTSTPAMTVTPTSAHLPSSPRTESMLKAKPPWCSCRHVVTPRARQSGKSPFMCSSTSASPKISSER